VAVDAVACGRISRFSRRIPALGVVGDIERVIINQRALKTAVGADNNAELLPKPSEVGIENGGNSEHENEGRPVLNRRRMHHLPQTRKRNGIAQEDVRDDRGAQQEQGVLDTSFKDLLRCPRGSIQTAAGGCVSFDPAFQSTKHLVEVNRLGTGPAAPDPTKQRGHEKDPEGKAGDDEKEQPSILKREGYAKEVKPLLRKVEEYRWMPVDLDPWQSHKKADQQPAREPSPSLKTTANICGVNGIARAIGIDRRQRVAAGLLDRILGHGFKRNFAVANLVATDRRIERFSPRHFRRIVMTEDECSDLFDFIRAEAFPSDHAFGRIG